MAFPYASGEAIDIRPLGSSLALTRPTSLVKTRTLGIIRLVTPSGRDIPTHQSDGGITVQCLEGRVTFITGNVQRDLGAGELLYLASKEPHSLHVIEDASVLVTKVL